MNQQERPQSSTSSSTRRTCPRKISKPSYRHWVSSLARERLTQKTCSTSKCSRRWQTPQLILPQTARRHQESGASWAPSAEARAGAKELAFLFRSTARPPIRNLCPTSAGLRQACSSRSWAALAGPLQELISSNKRKIPPTPSTLSAASSKRKNRSRLLKKQCCLSFRAEREICFL